MQISGSLAAALPSLRGVRLSLYSGWTLRSSLQAESVVKQGRPRGEDKMQTFLQHADGLL